MPQLRSSRRAPARSVRSIARACSAALGCLLLFSSADTALASGIPRVSGFALLRSATATSAASLDADRLAGQAQLGLDWFAGPSVWAHVHLLARTDDGGSEDGAIGVVEAFVEGSLPAAGGRVRLRGGAMFLPGSLENVDALWQTPYTLTPSALNTWLGEELRPIGVDASYSRSGLTFGGTVFRGNDTFGALPPVRGFALHDRWILLGEEAPVDGQVFTSVWDENDGRLGWAARAAWQGRESGVRFTHLDNRSDGLLYGDLYNWNTRLDIVGLETSTGGWTFAAESGWGPTFLVVEGVRIVSEIRASYLLVSRRLSSGRATLRLDRYDDGITTRDAATAAYLRRVHDRLSLGVEATRAGGSSRVLVQLRYAFAFR